MIYAAEGSVWSQKTHACSVNYTSTHLNVSGNHKYSDSGSDYVANNS